MRINPIVFPLALVIVSPLWANWGSDAGGSVGTGSFHAFGTDQVEMENENLEIRLFHDRAKVQVEYILTNTGSELDVRAGFPCLGLGSGSGAAKCVEVEDYQLEANGVLVPFQTEKGDVKNWKQLFGEDFLYMSERIAEDYGELIPRMLWLTSTVHFGKGESKKIKINYESLYEYSEGGWSNDVDYNSDYFRYLLSTGGAWKGPIKKGKVIIQAVTIDPRSITITPASRFEEKSQGFVWEFTNLEPSLDDDIGVRLNNKFYTIYNYASEESGRSNANWYSFEGNTYYFDFHGYTAKVSSELEGHPAKDISDLDVSTAWAAGRNGGLNESVTLTLAKPEHVDQIGIVPGYAKTKRLYFANNRVKVLEVVVNGSHTIKAVLPDEYISFSPASKKGYQLIDLGNYSGDAKTITLTVKEVYPGSKYNDTCISEVLLRKRLKEKPNVPRAG